MFLKKSTDLYALLYPLHHSYPHLVLLGGWHHPFEEIIDLLVQPTNKKFRIDKYLLSQIVNTIGMRILIQLKSTASKILVKYQNTFIIVYSYQFYKVCIDS